MGKFFTKKVVPVVLIIAMLFSMTMTSFATETAEPTVSMTASEIADGKFTVTVSVANNPGIDSFNWKLGYDSALVTPVYDADTFWGEVVSEGTLETNLADTEYVAGTPVSAVFAKADGTTVNGKVFAVDFALTTQAYNADINFTLDIDDTVTTGTFAEVADLTVKGPLAAVSFSSIEVTSVDSTEATISWDIVTTEAAHDVFVVLRDGVEIATLTTEDRSYTDTGLTEGTEYVYQVKCGEVLSAEVTAKTVSKAEEASTITLIPGGTNKSQTVNCEYTTYTLPEGTDYVRDGYTFAGWSADNGATILAGGEEVAVTGNIIYQGIWKKVAATPSTWVFYDPSTEVATISYNYTAQTTIGRNNGSYFFTKYPAIEDTDFFKAEYQNYGRHRNGYYKYNLYPVTEDDFTAAFGEYLIADNLNASGIELDPDTFEFPIFAARIYQSAENISSTDDPHRWLEGHDITSFVKANTNGFILAHNLTGGTETTEGLRLTGTKARIVTYHLPEEEDTTGRAVITFDANGGKGSITRIVADAGDEIVLPASGMTRKDHVLTGWTNGTTTYELGAKIEVTATTEFKAVWNYYGGGTATEEFDEKYFVQAGAYNADTAAYDDTIKAVTAGATGTKGINARMTAGSDGYRVRPYVYVELNLEGAVEAESAILNITGAANGTASNNTIKVQTVAGIPAVGDANPEAATIDSSVTYNSTTSNTANTVDITEAYNAAVGSTLYLRFEGYAWTDGKDQNYVTLDVDSLNLTVTKPEGFKVSFDANGGEGTLPETTFGTLTLPECELTNGDLAFAGWSDGKKVYSAGTEYTPAKDTVFKATWSQGVTITLDDNGTKTTVTVGAGGEIILPEGTAEASVGTMTFVGWNYAGTVYAAGEKVKADISKTYTAVYDYEGGEGNLTWVESWYFGTAENGAETGTLTKDPTGQKNLFRKFDTSAYYAKIDLRGVKNIKSAVLNVYHTKFNNAVTATVYDVTESAYNTAFANAVTGTFNTADLPAGTSVTSQKFSTSSSSGYYDSQIDITEYLAGKVAAGADYAYIKLANTASGNATTDAWRVNSFSTKAYVIVTTATMADVAFDMGAETISAEVGSTITLPACTALNGTLTFDGWTDGTAVYAAGDEYTVTGKVTFAATWKETAKIMYTYSGTLLEEVTPEAGAEVTLPAADAYDFSPYTLAGWNDGTATYEPGATYTFAGDAVVVFDAVVTFAGGGESTVEFGVKNYLTLGAYNADTAAYDDTVKSVAETSGTVSVNARMTKGNDGYRVRPFVVVSADLSQALIAESVILNFSVACSGSAQNTVYVRALDSMPAKGDAHTITTGDLAGSAAFTQSTAGAKTVDITTAYNEAVGSTLYLKIYGWAYAAEKAQNYVTLDVDSVNMTVTVPSGTPVMFNQGAASRTAEAGSTITLPEFTGTTPEGKAFTGWSDGTTTYAAGAEYEVPATSVTFTAQFADGVTLTVVGENNETKEFTFIAGDVVLPDAGFEKDGYTFYGYATAEKTIYAAGDTITMEEDAVLTAVFTKNLSIADWYLYYGATGYVANAYQKSHTLGRNNGSILFTSVDISGLDYEVTKATFYWTSKQQKSGYTYFTAYPVTGDYAATFADVAYNTITEEAVDITGLTLGTEIGRTAKNADAYIPDTAYVSGEYTISNLGTYFNKQYEAGNTTLQIGYKLNDGNSSAEGLRMYNSTANPAYMKVYVLAGARELVEYVPEVPAEPTATIDTFTAEATDAGVNLAWTATVENAENVEYVIYKDWEQLTTTTELAYVDTTYDYETTYTYQVVVAVDGEEIAWSDEIEVTTPAAPPAEPVTSIDSFTAVYDEASASVVMNWTATAENVTGDVSYIIYKDWEQYAITTELTYTDATVAPETTYYYQVVMVVGGEELSDVASEEIEVTTPAAPVVTPNVSVDTVEVTNVTYESATVTWTATTENVDAVTYDVVVNNDAVVKGITETTYTLTGLDAETAYTVKIIANYDGGSAEGTAEFTTANAPVVVEGTSSKVVLCDDGYYRYYPNGTDADPATGMWLLDGYRYYFSTAAAKYGAAQVNTTVKVSGVYHTFNEYGVATAYGATSTPDTVIEWVEPTTEVSNVTGSVTSTSATINWTAGATNAIVTGFEIYRDGELLDTVEADIDSTVINGTFVTGKGWTFAPVTGEFTYTDDTAFQNTRYTYTVKAIFEGGEGVDGSIELLTDAYASRYVTYEAETGYWKYFVDGVAQKGWITTPDGYRYYFSGSASKYGAAMVTTNVKVGSSYYDFTEYGALIDSYDEDGNPVLFFELNGFSTDDEGITRYYDKNVYRTGWQFIDGYKYYFSTANGKMLTGSMRVGSIYYLFDETDGHWVGYYQTPYTADESPKATDVNVCDDGYYRYYPNGTDADPMAGQWKVLPGEDGYYKYYFSSSSAKYGAAITGYEIQVGGAFYSFYPTGALMSVDVMEDGSAYMHPYKLTLEQGAKNGICLDDDGEYRFYIDGEYQVGLLEVDGYKYIFRTADGSAVTSADHTADGYYKRGAYNYVLDETGKILSKTLR